LKMALYISQRTEKSRTKFRFAHADALESKVFLFLRELS